MTLTLIATAPDGWALVRRGIEQWLITPPYTADHIFPQSDRQIARALMREDFELVGRDFEDWGSLCRQIREDRLAQTPPEEREAAAGAAERLLRHANPEQARRHLQKLGEALNAAPSAGIRKALTALLRADAVVADPELTTRATELLQRYEDLRALAAQPAVGRDAWRSSHAPGAADELARRFRGRISLIIPAA